MKTNDDRRYFVIEGPKAQALIDNVVAEYKRFCDAVKAVREKYGAAGVLLRKGHMLVGLTFKDNEPRKGIKYHASPMDGEYRAYPDKRFKAGRELVQDMQRASSHRSASSVILEAYGAARHAAVRDHMSPTGMSMAVSVATVLRCHTKIVMSIPQIEDDTYEVPEEGREIKKSEYIALTEEQ